ncbi:hypothetical protein M9H77_08080 [Catharanthus roseus]|uniref:Uncharacterized protein n=1 Tax=Catharanthus roseus TaxID=4058 RepID=A0ACC0BWY5_CATRO|nr:hypothetical protein M9H77_08080 [Catharanthus roseus]
MEFRKNKANNIAFITKLCWQMCKRPGKIWVKLLRSEYLCGRSMLDNDHILNSGSWIWNSIRNYQEYFLSGACYHIKPNSNLNIWEDPWIPDLPYFRPEKTNLVDQNLNLVSDLMRNNGTTWNERLIRRNFATEVADAIFKIHISDLPEQDNLVWYPSSSGKFTIKSAYRWNQKTLYFLILMYHAISGKIYGIQTSMGETKIFFWKAALDIILSKETFSSVKDVSDGEYYLCGHDVETTHHLVFSFLVVIRWWWNSRWQLKIDCHKHWDITKWVEEITSPNNNFPLMVVEKEKHAFRNIMF